jgi:hypothetical protein
MTNPATWTLAYRKRTANRFQRVTNWAGTWAQARELAGKFLEAHPELQVYYVPTVGADPDATVLTDSGRSVRIRDNGVLTTALLAQVPDAQEAQARWEDGAY